MDEAVGSRRTAGLDRLFQCVEYKTRFVVRLTRQPTMYQANTSMTNPAQVAP